MNHDSAIRALALGPDLLEDFVARLPEKVLDRNRGPGIWTVREHTVHLADVQPMLYRRMTAFQGETRPIMTPWDPKDEDEERRAGIPINEALRLFRSVRKDQVELLRSLDEGAWGREADHPEYDRYDLQTLVWHTLSHDGFHLYRMEEIAYVKREGFTRLP